LADTAVPRFLGASSGRKPVAKERDEIWTLKALTVCYELVSASAAVGALPA